MMIQALYDKKDQILLMNRAHVSGILLGVLKDYFDFNEETEECTDSGESKSYDDAVFEKYRSAYRIGGIYSCLLLWFFHDMRETPEEMAQLSGIL